MSDLTDASRRAQPAGSGPRPDASTQQGRLAVRERVGRLLDDGSFVEDGLLARGEPGAAGPDGVVTGIGTIAARPVAVMANDPSVMAGSWEPNTVEKILRIQEQAFAQRVPMVYLVDSAGARLTGQAHLVCGRRGAGRILHTQVKLSGAVPQVCVRLGPSVGGGAYIPAFCDLVIMREGTERGGAAMHTGVSGCGHLLVATDEEGIDAAKRYLSYVPSHWEWAAPVARPAAPASQRPIEEIVPDDGDRPFDMRELLDALLDAESFFELHARWAEELIVSLARLNGRAIGVVASQPAVRDGMLFVDSCDKAARFVNTCNAFNLPLLFLADVPGFSLGSAAERHGMIRHGAKLIAAVSEATVPKISVIVRRADSAGLCAMAGPGLEPDACLALPGASIAAMWAQADDAEEVDIRHLASELVVDAVVEPQDLRSELIRRFAVYAGKRRQRPPKCNAIAPV